MNCTFTPRSAGGRRALALTLLAAALVGCRTTPAPLAPLAPAAATTPMAAPAADGGVVLGESERFVVYQPGGADTLRSIARRFLGSEERYWAIGDFNDITEAKAGQPLVVPLTSSNPGGIHADQYQTVPILCYHRFGNGAASGKMVVSSANFAAQLDWLARNDYHVIRLEQLADFLEGRQALPRRSVVITIDDGYESVYRYALPLLRRHGFPATLFVYTDFIGAGNEALSWSQLQELVASGLVDVQAHSKSHRNLIERSPGETDAQYRQALEAEVRPPRELLERKLLAPVLEYAYPYGDANDLVLDVLARHHFELAVTVTPGGNPFFAQPLLLHRTMIFGDHDLQDFKARLQISRPIATP
jgi:peptidoglycan/xylan/chitin deacetylase (PgdA/CDA1 family)